LTFSARRPTIAFLALLIALSATSISAQSGGAAAPALCADCVRNNLNYLAGPELHGRGSGTPDEYHAAQFIAGQLKSYGLAPAAGNREYIQTAEIKTRAATAPPVLSFAAAKGAKPESVTWTHGKELAVLRLPEPDVSAPLQKLDLNDAKVSPTAVQDGAVVLLKLKPDASVKQMQNVVGPYLLSKAVLVIVPEPSDAGPMFEQLSKGLPRPQKKVGDEKEMPDAILLKAENAQQLWEQPDGTVIKLHSEMSPWSTSNTWNVLAKIEGKSRKSQIILLSAHLDHLGVRNGKTYPGADDDGSGTVAVMELARALAKERRPQRTVIVALWGSEELGLIGSRYFLKHPTFELKDIVANLEFEMIGRADPLVKPEQLWLSGWERSDLGPELAAHGALLVGDPHPEQQFFQRSDNYALAKEGVVAQTVSSYGLHKDYHQPTDTVENVDWKHLDSAIGSMITPVSWLANSDFTPKWNKGMKP
jgi:aminopeptidase YwaD